MLIYPTGTHVVIFQGRKECVLDDQFRLMAEMYACLKTNQNDKSIFKVLTNESLRQFFKLDSELKIQSSGLYIRRIEMPKILGILYAMFFNE